MASASAPAEVLPVLTLARCRRGRRPCISDPRSPRSWRPRIASSGATDLRARAVPVARSDRRRLARTVLAQCPAMDTHSFYIGPGNPPLRLSQWNDLVTAAETGTLTETQWVELKAAIPASSPAANLEVARDLASLSVDGGVLTVGVKNPGTKAEHVVGSADDMEGLKDRIDQIASSTRIQPPLNVRFAPPIANPANPTRAILLVTVPASASAPHMVDGKYWGRGATGKRPLLDVEVSRLMMECRGRRDDFVEKLRSLNPGSLPGPVERRNGHLYVMAEPAVGFAQLSLTVAAAGQHPRQLVANALSFHPTRSPSFESLAYVVNHPDGLALASWSLSAETPDEKKMLYLLLTDGGSVQLTSGQGTLRYGQDGDRIGIPANFTMEIVHQTLHWQRTSEGPTWATQDFGRSVCTSTVSRADRPCTHSTQTPVTSRRVPFRPTNTLVRAQPRRKTSPSGRAPSSRRCSGTSPAAWACAVTCSRTPTQLRSRTRSDDCSPSAAEVVARTGAPDVHRFVPHGCGTIVFPRLSRASSAFEA